MRKNILRLIPIVFVCINALSVNAQWIDASTNNDPYVANDFGFFQSRSGVSFNYNSQSKTDYRRTTDGGQTWAPLAINNVSPLTCISTVNTTTGFAAGSQLAVTTDAGTTWDSVPNISFVGLSRSQIVFQKIAFASAKVGFATLAASGNIIYKTTDGGKSWTTADRASGTITALYAYNTLNVYAIINDTALAYTNNGGGGTTWNTVPPSVFNFTNIYSVYFLSAKEGYVTGASGNLFHTLDSGATWKNITMDTSVNLLGMQFLDPGNAIISGASEVAFSTSDSGKTWHHHYMPDPNRLFLYDLTKAYYFDKYNGAALGNTGRENALLYIKDLNAGVADANKNSLGLEIYPNPSTGIININTAGMDGNGLMMVYNSTGKIVLRRNIEKDSHQSISLNAYGKGIYIIEIATGSGIGRQQIVIE